MTSMNHVFSAQCFFHPVCSTLISSVISFSSLNNVPCIPYFSIGLGLLRCFLLWMVSKFSSGANFEILQAYLHRLLAVYAELILKQPDALSVELEKVRAVHAASSNRFRFLVQSNICLLKMFAGLPPT